MYLNDLGRVPCFFGGECFFKSVKTRSIVPKEIGVNLAHLRLSFELIVGFYMWAPLKV